MDLWVAQGSGCFKRDVSIQIVPLWLQEVVMKSVLRALEQTLQLRPYLGYLTFFKLCELFYGAGVRHFQEFVTIQRVNDGFVLLGVLPFSPD